MSTFYEENYEFFLTKEAINFMENIGRLIERPSYDNLCDLREDMILYGDLAFTEGYRCTCRTCRLRIAPIKYMSVDLLKIKVSRLDQMFICTVFRLRN